MKYEADEDGMPPGNWTLVTCLLPGFTWASPELDLHGLFTDLPGSMFVTWTGCFRKQGCGSLSVQIWDQGFRDSVKVWASAFVNKSEWWSLRSLLNLITLDMALCGWRWKRYWNCHFLWRNSNPNNLIYKLTSIATWQFTPNLLRIRQFYTLSFQRYICVRSPLLLHVRARFAFCMDKQRTMTVKKQFYNLKSQSESRTRGSEHLPEICFRWQMCAAPIRNHAASQPARAGHPLTVSPDNPSPPPVRQA